MGELDLEALKTLAETEAKQEHQALAAEIDAHVWLATRERLVRVLFDQRVAILAALEEREELRQEVRRALRFSRSRGLDRDYVVQYGSGIRPSEVPYIAAILRDREAVEASRE